MIKLHVKQLVQIIPYWCLHKNSVCLKGGKATGLQGHSILTWWDFSPYVILISAVRACSEDSFVVSSTIAFCSVRLGTKESGRNDNNKMESAHWKLSSVFASIARFNKLSRRSASCCSVEDICSKLLTSFPSSSFFCNDISWTRLVHKIFSSRTKKVARGPIFVTQRLFCRSSYRDGSSYPPVTAKLIHIRRVRNIFP